MINVLLIDDHNLVRSGIRKLLEDSGQVKITSEGESGEDALEMAFQVDADVILMDLNMPGIGGIEATRRIMQRDAQKKIIILTIQADQAVPRRLLEIGARGYLTKECAPEDMITAIRQVHFGGTYIEDRIAQQLAVTFIPGQDSNPVNQLSRREFQVMIMLAQGKSNADISDRLCLSPKTISTYRTRIMKKLEVQNEVELVKMAVDQGLVDFQTSESS